MGFLKWLIITVVILWLFRKFGGFLFKRWVKNVTQRPGYQQYDNARRGSKNVERKEGEVYISKKTPPKDSQTDGLGDFVDFEEVE